MRMQTLKPSDWAQYGGAQGYIGQMIAQGLTKPQASQYTDDPHGFIFGNCYTVDQSDPKYKIKLIPDLPHIRLLIQRVCVDRVHPLLVAKSRRMVVSWLMTACELWEVVEHEHRGVFVQSKKHDDSCELVNRHWLMLNALPAERYPTNRKSEDGVEFASGLTVKRYKGGQGGTGKLEFSNGSFIQAVSEGPDQLRQFGASLIRQEEIAFWERQEESYDAAIECVQGSASSEGSGGQLVAVTTANPSWFGAFAYDQEGVVGGVKQVRKLDIKQPVQGVKEWTTSVGATTIEVHYTADPDKRSNEWITKTRRGQRQRGWDREMEIHWDVYQGMPVFGDCFNERLHVAPEPVVWDGVSHVLRGWDYGNTPACTFSFVQNGIWYWHSELCTDKRPLGTKEPPPSSNIDKFGDLVVQYCSVTFPGAEFIDIDDPSGDQKAQTDGRSCRDYLAAKGIYPSGGEMSIKGRLEAMALWLSRLANGQPTVQIDASACPMLTEGMKGGYRYAEVGNTGRYQDKPEKNQFSHPIDTACYVASRILNNIPERQRTDQEYLEDHEAEIERDVNRSGLYY